MADECELTSYDELIEVITNLRFLVREKRRRERLSIRSAAEQAGLSVHSTVYRFERGHSVHTDTLVPLIRWVAGGGALADAVDTWQSTTRDTTDRG